MGVTASETLLEGLNEPQREAVLHGEGPLLILAGAGSGKTRVLTHRIAHLVGSGQARPGEILAITFTNKAAQEMRERVEQLVGNRARAMWVMTFHSACARILRAEAEKLGYTRGFTIYDEQDSLRLVKACIDELDTVNGGADVTPSSGFHVPPELHEIHARSERVLPGHILTWPIAVAAASVTLMPTSGRAPA